MSEVPAAFPAIAQVAAMNCNSHLLPQNLTTFCLQFALSAVLSIARSLSNRGKRDDFDDFN